MAALKKKVLSTLSWDGRIQAKLFVLVDPQGNRAKSSSPIGYFAKLNEKGLKTAQLIGTLDDTRFVCQTTIKDVSAESARVGGKCKAIEKALRLADKEQTKLLTKFNVGVDNAKVAGKRVGAARSDMLAAIGKLKVSEKELRKFNIDNLAKKTDDQRKALEKERDEAIEEIGKIISAAKTIVSLELHDAFELAVNFVSKRQVESEYASELKELAKKVASLNAKSAGLAKEIKVLKIDVASHELDAAVAKYGAAESDFNAAIIAAAEARKNLMNELDGTASRALSDFMRARKIQVKYVEVARRNIWEYKTGLLGALKSLSILSNSYKSAKGTLKKVAKKDKSYNPESDYGKAVVAWAFLNGHELEAWKRYAASEIGYCKKQEKYLNDDGVKGPFEGFHKMDGMVQAARDKTRRELKANRLECPI